MATASYTVHTNSNSYRQLLILLIKMSVSMSMFSAHFVSGRPPDWICLHGVLD